MYNEGVKSETPKAESAIRNQWGRIERSLVNSHDTMSSIERWIDNIYQEPEEGVKQNGDIRSEPKTFFDAMCKLADMAEALENRLNKARRNTEKAI